MAGLRSTLDWKWVTARRCATSNQPGYNLRVPRLGQNARMKNNNAMFSYINYAPGKPIPPWSYGLPTSAG